MKKYKVIGSSDPAFMNIEMNFVFDDISMGKTCEVFNNTFTITQTGKIIVLSSEKWVLTLLDITPEVLEDKWNKTITNPKDLRINHEIDIFVEKKLIKINTTDRLTHTNRTTYECLYKFLKNEWKYIHSMTGVSFPFEYDHALKLFTMRDEWNFDSGNSFKHMTEGSYSRYAADGRCI